MDPEVLEDLYRRAKEKGYPKSIEDFQSLLNSDEEVLNDNFQYVKSKGYPKSISEFALLVEKKNLVEAPSVGVEEVMESPSEDGSMVSVEETTSKAPLLTSDNLIETEEPSEVRPSLREDFFSSMPVEESLEDKSLALKQISEKRGEGRLNEDGSKSTVLYASAQVDGKNIVYPTLFKEGDDFIELSADEAIDRAYAEGEVVEFNNEEDAQKYAEGEWKDKSLFASVSNNEEFENSLKSSVNEEMISRTEEFVVPEMNYKFGKYGFKFTQRGAGTDSMKVLASNGEETNISLDRIFFKKRTSKKLEDFLRLNKKEVDNFTQQTDALINKTRIVQDEQDVLNTVKTFNKKTRDFTEKYNEFRLFAAELTKEYDQKYSNITQENLDSDPALAESYNAWKEEELKAINLETKLRAEATDLGSKGALLDKLAGEYSEMQAKQGKWAGALWNRIAKLPETLASFGAEQSVNSLSYVLNKTGGLMQKEEYLSELIRITREEGLVPEEYQEPGELEKLNEKQLIEALGGNTNDFKFVANKILDFAIPQRTKGLETAKITTPFDYANSKILDLGRKQILQGAPYDEVVEGRYRNPLSAVAASTDLNQGIKKSIKEGLDFLKSDNVTEQWDNAKSENFWGGAILGVAESLPIMAVGLAGGPMGWGATTAGMFALTSEYADQEMNSNPFFDDISESEKATVKLPIAIAVSALESIGFRNILKQKGFLNYIVGRAIGKSVKNTSSKTFQEIIRQDIKGLTSRGLLTLGAAGAAEFETGFAQQIAEIGVKDIYNAQKETRAFSTPETWREYGLEVVKAGAQEMIGGFIMGTPTAVSNAVASQDVANLDDNVFSVFQNMIKDDEYKSMYVSKLKQRITDPSSPLDAEQAKAELETVNKIESLFSKIPEGYNVGQKKRALELLYQKEILENEIEKEDKVLSKRKQELLKQVNNELGSIDVNTIIAQQESLNKEEDAIQESSTESVDVQEQAGASEGVRRGDTTEQITAEESTSQEGQEQDVETQVEEVAQNNIAEQDRLDIDLFFDETNKETEVKSQNLVINKTDTSEGDATNLKSNVINIAQLGAKAISKVLPNVKIVMHQTNDQYLKYAKLGEGRAEYNPENTTIHINLSKATNTTVPHEIFHAVLMEKVKTDPAIAKAAERMVLSVQKVVPKDSELGKRIEAFAKQYEGQFQNEERLAELVGILSSEYRQLDKPSKNIIVEFLKSIAKKFSIDIGVDFGKEDADVIDLLNVISRKTKGGEVIEESDIQSLEQGEKGDKELKDDEQELESRQQKITNEETQAIKKVSELYTSIQKSLDFADKSAFNNKLEFKKALQDRFNKDTYNKIKETYNVKDNKSNNDSGLKEYLIDAYLNETLTAIEAYPDALGWYDSRIKGAMSFMEELHPELATDKNAESTFKIALAITSNGNKVYDNFVEANRQYEYFKENGKFDENYSIGDQKNGILSTLRFTNKVLQSMSMSEFTNFLTSKYRAGDLKYLKDGKKTPLLPGFAVDEEVYGASIFGPKIGNGFFMNLYGEFNQLTMDRWFMRQYGRITGTLLDFDQAKVDKGDARLKKAIKGLGVKRNKVLESIVPDFKNISNEELANKIQKSSMDLNKRALFKSDTKLDEVRKAGNNLSKLYSAEVEAPTNSSQRKFINEVFSELQSKLKEDYGIDITIADLQAVNWYPEKALYQTFKADQNIKQGKVNTSDNEQPDYQSAAKKFIKTKGISENKIKENERRRSEQTKREDTDRKLIEQGSRQFNKNNIKPSEIKRLKDKIISIKEEVTSNDLKESKETTPASRQQIDDSLSKASGRTQRENTRGSYVKAANIIKDREIEGDVLDYGAGLGVGTDAMTKLLGRKVDSFEINTENWKGKAKPTYTSAKDIDKKYDSIVSLNVVNVVPKNVRDFIVTDIFEKLNEGGTAVISSRGFKGDVANAKNFEPGLEEKSYLIKVSGDQQYQKGFDGNELVDYVQGLLGDNATVIKNNTFGKTGVVITKGPQSRQQIEEKPSTPSKQKSIRDYIIEGRDGGFQDDVIKDFLIRVKKFSVAKVNSLMKLNVDILSKMPKSFGNIQGGASAGLKLFKRIRDYKQKITDTSESSDKLTPKELKDKINAFIKKRKEQLKANKKYIQEIKKDQSGNFVEMSEYVNKANAKLKRDIEIYTERQTKINDSKTPILTQQEIMDKTIEFLEKQPEYKAASTIGGRLITKTMSSQQALMLADLQSEISIRPSENISEKIIEAKRLVAQRITTQQDISKVKSALRNFLRKSLPKELYSKKEVINLVNKINIAKEENLSTLLKELESFVIGKNIETLKNKLEKLLNISLQKMESGIIKGDKVDNATRKRLQKIKSLFIKAKNPDKEKIITQNTELLEKFNQLNKISNPTTQEIQEMVNLELAMKYNNQLMLDDKNPVKVSELDTIVNNLNQILKYGRSSLAEELRKDRERGEEQFKIGYQAIIGDETLNVDELTEEDLIDQSRIAEADTKREKKKKTRNIWARFYNNIREFDLTFAAGEAMDGLMARLDKLPGELFGGALQEMFTDKVDVASREFKERMMQFEDDLQIELENIFGEKWKKSARKNQQTQKLNIKIRDTKQGPLYLEDLSQNQLATWYNAYKNPDNIQSFTTYEMWGVEKINPSDTADEKKRKQAINSLNAKRVMQEIESKLDPKVKQIADYLVDVLYPELYNHYNEAYRKTYRTDMPYNQYYAGTISREGVEESELDVLSALGQSSMYKQSVRATGNMSRVGSQKPIIAIDMMNVLNTYVNQMEYFSAYQGVVKDMGRFFQNKYTKSAIIDIHGSDIYNLVRSIIEKIAARGSQQNSFGAKAVNSLNSAFVLSRLALSPVIMVKQLTSLFTYIDNIGITNWLLYSAKNKLEQRKIWKEVSENSVYLKDRQRQSIFAIIESYSEEKMKEFVPQPTKQWLINFAMWTTKSGDRNAILLGGLPNYSYYKAKALKNGKTEEQAIKEAIVLFERDTKRTQQSQDIQDKDFFQTSDPITRALNMFLTTPKQYLRKEIIATRNLYRAMKGEGYKGTILENVRSLILYHGFMPLFFQYVTMGLPGILRDRRDDDDVDYIRAMVLGNLNALFVVGQLAEMAVDLFANKPWAGEGSKSLGILEMGGSVAKKLGDAFNTKDPEKKREKFTEGFLEIASMRGGIPFLTMKKYYENIESLPESNDPGQVILKLMNYSKFVQEGKPKKKSRGNSRAAYIKRREKELENNRKKRETSSNLLNSTLGSGNFESNSLDGGGL